MTTQAALFRRVAGRFPTGVTVLTTETPDGPFGMTANSFTTVSLDPRLVLVCLGEQARIREHLLASGRFTVSVLSAGQRSTALRFARRDRALGTTGFADDAWAPAPVSGIPVLVDGCAWFDCAVREVHPAGDHSIVVGEVHALDLLPAEHGLVFTGGDFHRAAPLTPALEASA